MKYNISARLFGNDTILHLRQRVFNVVILMGIIMSFSASLFNYVLGLGTVTVIVPFLCGVVTIGLYMFYIIGRHYELSALLVVIMLSFIFFPTMWFINAGTYGSIPYYMIINAGIIALLLEGLKRWVIFALYMVFVGILIVIEYRVPEIILKYDSTLVRYQDISFGLFICLFFIVVIIAFFLDSYLKEHKRAENYLSTLKEQNKEIEAKNRMLEDSNAKLKEAKEKTEYLNNELYKEKQELYRLSITDNLTGTFNKTYITARLNEEIKTSHENKKKITIAMIDIDNFKGINDTYGHLFGDYALKRVSETINENLREKDIIGRYGGDEFLIVLPDTNREEGYTILDRIRKKICELEWENDLVVTISGGVTELVGEQLTNLLKNADELLYKAKLKSKNRIENKVG